MSNFITFLNPIIEALKELGGSGTVGEVTNKIIEKMNIPEEEQDEACTNILLAKSKLANLGFADSSKYGVWNLTEKGQKEKFSEDLIQKTWKPERGKKLRGHQKTGMTFLSTRNFPIGLKNRLDQIRQNLDMTFEFILGEAASLGADILEGKLKPESSSNDLNLSNKKELDINPDSLENDFGDSFEVYKAELLYILKSLPPEGFERICQRLLRESGFQQVIVTGKSGDGGIDGEGILQINPFVSFKILFQCKRYDKSVASSTIRDFRGAMSGRADKGIILTTGSFTLEAKKEANREGVTPIELVDGNKIVEMFEAHNLGINPKKVVELDHSFFDTFR